MGFLSTDAMLQFDVIEMMWKQCWCCIMNSKIAMTYPTYWSSSPIMMFMIFHDFVELGFLSIDCGASAPYVDSRNISWVPDTSYMTLGSTASVTLPSSFVGLQELSTLRYFPDATRKRFCYLLPTKAGQTYMVRPRFYHGGYDSYPTLSFHVNFESFYNSTFSFTPTADNLYQEYTAVATSTNMQLCLVRTSASDTPFISSIEMRLLDSGMYTTVQDGSGLAVQSRANYAAGQSDVIRWEQSFQIIYHLNSIVSLEWNWGFRWWFLTTGVA